MDALLQTALLGTEKKNLDMHALPQPVQDALLQAAPQDAEHQLLQAISYVTFYQAAGAIPKKLATPVDETIVCETRSVAPDDLLQLFGKFEVVSHQIQETLLSNWLEVIHKRKEIVSPELVVNLIQYGKNMTSATRAKIMHVIGNKGRWILQYDTTHNYPLVRDDDERWNEGTTADRKKIFTAWRAEDQTKALTRLLETWETEAIASKKMFLEIIIQTITVDDLPFIERLYNEEFHFRPKEKKTEKECRKLLASILLRFSDTKLYKQTTAQLETCFTRGRTGLIGMITGKENVSFQLPESEDAFWNASNMEQQYGFEVKSYDIARYNTIIQFWMAHFLQYIPMTFWCAAYNDDYTRTLQYWLTSAGNQTKINGENTAIFQPALIANVKDQRDTKLAATLVTMLSNNPRMEILPYMSPADYEEYVNRENLYDYDQVLQHGPYTAEQCWPQPFSDKVINESMEQAMHNNSTALFGKVIAQYAHPGSINTLIVCNSKAHDTTWYNNWNNNVFQVALPAFEIRNKINLYKK
jgi:Family of unknown function (DUF5691)